MMKVEQYVALKTSPCQPDAGLFTEAEKEMSAFLFAVTAVNGQQCVTTAAEHWIQALEGVCPSTFVPKDCFRKVTLEAVVSLNHR